MSGEYIRLLDYVSLHLLQCPLLNPPGFATESMLLQGASDVYRPGSVKLPTFEVKNRKNWCSIPKCIDPKAYFRWHREDRTKRGDPVILPYYETPTNHYALKRQWDAEDWLKYHAPAKFKLENRLSMWPYFPFRIQKAGGPGLLVDEHFNKIQGQLQDDTLANISTPFGRVFGTAELRWMVVCLLGHGSILNLQRTCKLLHHGMATDREIHFDVNSGNPVEVDVLKDWKDSKVASGEVVVGAFSDTNYNDDFYCQLLEDHVKIYQTLHENRARITHLTLQDVRFLDLSILRMLCNSMQSLKRIKVVSCEQISFLMLPGLIEIVAETPLVGPDGKKVFRELDFCPPYYDGPQSADREGSFGAFWNQLQGNFTKTLCSFIKEWYFPAKAVGINFLELGTGFRHWIDRTPYSGDMTIVALHEALDLVYRRCADIHANLWPEYSETRNQIISEYQQKLTDETRREEMAANFTSAKASLAALDAKLSKSKAAQLASARKSFADNYFAILTANEAEPLRIAPELVERVVRKQRPNATPTGMISQDSWRQHNACVGCGKGRGRELYSKLTSLVGDLSYVEAGDFTLVHDEATNTDKILRKATLVFPSPGTLAKDFVMADVIAVVSKFRTDFNFASPWCYECRALAHLNGLDATHHFMDLKRELLQVWTSHVLQKPATLENLLANTAGYDAARQVAVFLQGRWNLDCYCKFDLESAGPQPHLENRLQRIRRKLFPHDGLDRERAEVQYRSIGTTYQYVSESYLPENFETNLQLHATRDLETVRKIVQAGLLSVQVRRAEELAKWLGVDVCSTIVKQQAPIENFDDDHPQVLRRTRLLLEQPEKGAALVGPEIRAVTDPTDREAVDIAKIEFGNARVAPNFIDGDWDQMRRRRTGYKDIPAEQLMQMLQWSTGPSKGTDIQTSVYVYEPHPSSFW
ncbi:hypothetical protein GQ53DRAFT_830551 [Thozetella sp. PMI_491]|nr:hypothetical protein GQ53DRAFT_830551 [Thozetella sp. PMI_491]